MADSGSTEVADLAVMIYGHEFVHIRMVLIGVTDGWRLVHGEVTLDGAVPIRERTWRYADVLFLERRVPGPMVGALLRGEPQDLDGLRLSTPAPQRNGIFHRLAGQREWRRAVMPWPRTEWEVQDSDRMPTRPGGVLVGDGPAFINFEAAVSSFFHGAPPSNVASQQPLWRIIRLDRRAWLQRVTVGPDALTVAVKGSQLDGVDLEMTTPTTQLVRPVGRTGKLRLRLPKGLAPSTLLLLRHHDEWLDFRYFPAATPGREHDASVVWDQPGVELDMLLAGGEGPYVEFKQELPATRDSKRKMLKTVAAFASGEGGVVLFGVDDDTQVVGIDPTALDQQKLAIGNMIRDSIEPEPTYTLRVTERDGKTLLLDVATGGQWHALDPDRPQFYVRRGASTVPARLGEIADGFGAHPGRSTPLP